jgi:hypothetical protein
LGPGPGLELGLELGLGLFEEPPPLLILCGLDPCEELSPAFNIE